jgi:hypothetical protein
MSFEVEEDHPAIASNPRQSPRRMYESFELRCCQTRYVIDLIGEIFSLKGFDFPTNLSNYLLSGHGCAESSIF